MTVGVLAAIIVALLLLQLAIVALVGLYRRKHQHPSAKGRWNRSPPMQSR